METKVENKADAIVANAVEAKVDTAIVAVVETEAKADNAQLSTSTVETAQAVVEAVKDAKEETKVEVKEVAVEAVQLAKPNPVAPIAVPHDELERFVTAFGAEKAVSYLMAKTPFNEAVAAFAKDVTAENAELKKRLSAIDRGAKPVAFSDSIKRDASNAEAAKPKGMAAVIKMANQAKKK